ncbi:MAG: glycosyl transferase, family 51 [Marmoricola sp.]|nr:glycosyl transferase, family 51 [Marmoricola sp.]
MSSRRPSQLTSRVVTSHLGVMVALAAVTGLLVAGLAIPFAGAIGIGAHQLASTVKDLPEELEEAPLAQRTRVLDSDNHVIATFYDQNRVNVPLSKVAPIMQQAIVAIEDYRFYEHGAIDVKGTLRAFVTNQANDGITQGGSSITQQMVKMTLINQASTKAEREAATADTYQRKLTELRYAIGTEKKYSKDWILERYLNIAYFGDGVYGIQSAARHYFSTTAAKLTLSQASVLAGLVKNPVGYDPTTFPEKAKDRRDTVLARMAQLDVIDQAQADKISGEGLGLKVSPTRNGCLGSKAAFFCDYVRRYLLQDPSLGETVDDRQRLLNSGGLTIKTTVDLAFQKAADKSTSAHVKATDRAIGALAMVEPGTGNVRAISQSRPMGRSKKKGETFLNYVVDSKYGDSNGFQAGSTFKLFVLSTALEEGLPATTAFNSPGRLSIPQNEYETCDGPYQSTTPWDVSNSTKNGRMNMYSGMQLSVNTYFAQLEKKVGICKPYAMARAMGVDLTDPSHEMVPSFTLGVADVSPLEMAGAYATVAARGLHCANRPVTRILNADGKVFKDYPKDCKQVVSQNTADTVNDILRGVMQRGGFGAALALDKPSAAKTGTRQENKAVWLLGYTPSLATASMIAGADQNGVPITLNNQTVGGQYIASAHGSTTAGPMWADAMRAIQDLLPDEDFVKPSRALNVAFKARVPYVAGKSVSSAVSALEAEGFVVKVRGSRNGTATSSTPRAGSTVTSGSTVTVNSSRGGRKKPKNSDQRTQITPPEPGNGGQGNGGRGFFPDLG